MAKLQLKFDTDTVAYTIEVPYKDGVVITSEYCPTECYLAKVDILAACRGEPLDEFMEGCRKQISAITRIKEADTPIDRHIGGLMAVVMDHLSRYKGMALGELLKYVDCFSHLLKGAGYKDEEINEIYPRVTQTIRHLYKDYIKE